MKRILHLIAAASIVSPVLHAQTCAGPTTYLAFSAADQDHVRIPNPPAGGLDGFANFTIECWMKVSSGTGVDTLVSKWRQLTAGQTAYLFRLYGGRLQFYFDNSFGFTGNAIVVDGTWHHVAVRRIGPTLDLIVDGAIDASFTYAPLMGTLNGPVVLGAFLDQNDALVGGTFLNGSLDEVRIWSVGRTLAQIQATKNQAVSGGSPGLKGCWRLDAGSGQLVTDASPTGANGFLGATNAAGVDDPAWSNGGPVLGYPCGSGAGNANTTLASLYVNGVGDQSLSGPFPVQVYAGGTLTFSWSGPPGKPVALFAGPSHPANTTIPGLGIIDIGTPPTLADLVELFDGTSPQNALFFTLGAGGTATQTFTLPPALPAGAFFNIQGAVFQPAGTTPYGIVITAAFQFIG